MTTKQQEYLRARVTARMRSIVDFVIDGRPTWDLCCDHGLIGLWAWHQRDLEEVHFVDRAPGVVRELERRVRENANPDGCFFHERDAAELQFSETPSNIIISGIGYRASQRIIAAIDPTAAAHRLILSVHAEDWRVPDAMQRMGWTLAGENLVEEQGRERRITAWNGCTRDGVDSASSAKIENR